MTEIRIQTPPGAAEPVLLAARELERYLGRMLPQARVVPGEGGELCIALRAENAPEEEPDAYRVEIAARGGAITGNRPGSLLLAVYDYLTRLGCRFPGPAAEEELVPEIGLAALPMSYTRQASFRHRGVCIEGANSLENALDFIAWLPKLGFNSFFLQFETPYTFFARWYHRERNPYARPEAYSLADARRDAARLEREIKRRGLRLHAVGHGWTGRVLGYESVDWKPDERPLPPERRPLAALVNGRRELFLGIPLDTHLCYSSPEAVDRFASLVVGYARSHPQVDYLHIWLADEYNNVCECPLCRETTLSDQYVRLLNEIDRRLTREGLGTRLVFLLYQELLWPPRRERLRNKDRFVLMFAPISRTFERPYSPEGRPGRLPPYRRNRVTLPSSLPQNLAFLERWQRQFQGDGFVYDYPLGRAHYGDFGYLHIARIIGRDIKQLRTMGLDGSISCQELRAGMPNFLPNYVMGRLLFDREAEIEDVIDEYFRAAYGAGFEEAKAFLEALSALECCDYVNGIGPRLSPEAARRAEQARDLCRAYAPLLEANRVRGPAWERLAFHRALVERLTEALACLARGEEALAWERWLELRRFAGENEPRFQSYLDVYRLLDVTAKYTGFRPNEANREEQTS